MVIRLGDLKFKNPQAVSYQDLADTLEESILIGGLGAAQNAYQTLQANNVFENKDYLLADEFTDSDGTNGTVNTGSSSAFYDSNNDYYICQINGDGTNDTETHGETLSSTASTSNRYRGIAFTMNNNAILKTVAKSTNCTADTCYLMDSDLNILSQVSFSGNVATFNDENLISGRTYSIGADRQGPSYNQSYISSGLSFPYLGTNLNVIGGETGSGIIVTSLYNIDSIVVQTGDYGESTVLIDTNTKTLTGNEKSCIVYADQTNTSNTSITVDVSDGTNTVSDKPVNDYIDVSSLSSGTLELTFNLKTTDTTETPEFKGYGVFIK